MLVSLTGSSILSEGCQHLDSQDGALQCYYDPLNPLPVSRLLLPLSELERSDFVLWPLPMKSNVRPYVCCLRVEPKWLARSQIDATGPTEKSSLLKAMSAICDQICCG
jgi:hypothetical protein